MSVLKGGVLTGILKGIDTCTVTAKRFDDKGRIAELQSLDYDFVSAPGVKSDDLGSKVRRRTGTKENGDPQYSYLMETPEESYREGVADKEAINRQVDEALRANRDPEGRLNPETAYGKNSLSTT